jgi:ribosome maturation protein Sdo1
VDQPADHPRRRQFVHAIRMKGINMNAADPHPRKRLKSALRSTSL